ncbi:hypothetical protein MPTK1_8g13370 [Marchantia polymorpha subsp. ruderalis]|uniref:Uncharacterized protein n=1 Tax=Marchantia polymorpha TaxID=3197 RepID=A0A2R6WCE5_MARPO|nr:hypothetical protein MARPO_0110s0018 [Marchantia polymorpha]BBN19758.1 hypothetical protein Mp_8g13370 [Marchantia polymorpha subsp. ruderalis]|eukprot:PTQ31525.1 hypothetical protein MARPO_0110s0018 [Marchantia polymorpha]
MILTTVSGICFFALLAGRLCTTISRIVALERAPRFIRYNSYDRGQILDSITMLNQHPYLILLLLLPPASSPQEESSSLSSMPTADPT